jgi:endonuclease YncB( thermonuclease family)
MIDPRLKARRRLHWILGSIAALILAVVISDRAGAFGYRGDDYARFDRIGVIASSIINGDTFVAPDIGEVRLLGIDASAKHWADQSMKYLEARLKGRTVTLKLDGTQTRDAQGRLLAYVYITDNDCVNVDIVRDAQAFADRRIRHTLKSAIELAENEARKKKRGMWREMTDDQQPAWRIEWLQSRRARASSSSSNIAGPKAGG